MKRTIGADGDGPERRAGRAVGQRLFEPGLQAASRFAFIRGHGVDIAVDEALPRQRAIKAEQLLVRRGVFVVVRGRRQECAAHVRQQAFETGIGDRIGFEQAAQQPVLRQRADAGGAEKLLWRKPLRPGVERARDGVLHRSVQLDQADAHAGQFARPIPGFRDRTLQQMTDPAVIRGESRGADALREERPILRRFADFERARGDADGQFQIAGRRLGSAEILIGDEDVGPQLDRPFEIGNGFDRLGLRHQRRAQHPVCFGVGRKQCQNMAVSQRRFGEGAGAMPRQGSGEKVADERVGRRFPAGGKRRFRARLAQSSSLLSVHDGSAR